MSDKAAPSENEPVLLLALGWYAIVGCLICGATIVIAPSFVPDYDWFADTISDLAAGEYESIVDIGIYAFSASLISIALLAAHSHMGGWGWSVGTVGFAALGLIVFLVGARNEYGDSDDEGVVIHIYLIFAIAGIMAVLPWAMSRGARKAGRSYARILIAISAIWTISTPIFFVLPTQVEGIYERYLALLAVAAVVTLAWLFIERGRKLSQERYGSQGVSEHG